MGLLVTLAVVGVSYIILFPPKTEAGKAADRVTTEEGFSLASLEAGWSVEREGQQAAQTLIEESIGAVDPIGALVGIIALVQSRRNWEANKESWADGVIEVWKQLPDTWFLERSNSEALQEVMAYFPYPVPAAGFKAADLMNAVTNGTAYLHPAFERIRMAYAARIPKVKGEPAYNLRTPPPTPEGYVSKIKGAV